MPRPVQKPKFQEGPQAAKNFDAAMRKILKVTPEEIKRRIDAERTFKTSASRVPVVSR